MQNTAAAWLMVTLTPSPLVGGGDVGTEGPIAVQVIYAVPPHSRDEFIDVAQRMGVVRRRDGALVWRLYRDLSDPNRYVEFFLVDSWVDYLRHRRRATVADRQLERRLMELHAEPGQPQMQHYVAQPAAR
jgi:quinol monooxygenase YgiN